MRDIREQAGELACPGPDAGTDCGRVSGSIMEAPQDHARRCSAAPGSCLEPHASLLLADLCFPLCHPAGQALQGAWAGL